MSIFRFRNTYSFPGRQPKPVKTRNWYVRTVFFYPSISSCLASNLFISISRSKILSNAVRKGEANKNSLLLTPFKNSDWNTNIVASMNPFTYISDSACISRVKMQVMSKNILDQPALALEEREELSF